MRSIHLPLLASLGLATLALGAASGPAAADACNPGCSETQVEPCVGAFASGYSSHSATWTLTYRYPGGSVTATSVGHTPPPSATGGACWMPGCYYASLVNDRGHSDSPLGVCI